MIEWYTWLSAGIAAAAGLLCLAVGLAGRKPGDVTVFSVVLVELLLVAQVVISIVAPIAGNQAQGDVIEFWIYLVVAIIIPPAAVLWSLIDRNRWSTVILGVAALSIAVMVVRMQQIWSGNPPFLGA
ncbi:hypothetical protein GCM10011490_05870 [Pseudoclavibacter endophyticus]|uniref:Integral membrane protein n=1 Tax=Pseudoclavibacter endophyticus TaxID=1778590 RepID=A0A6H9WSL1_9MICO|nr:hypothetical protein [Pseudoclavibacter endophyticus]KAB1649917.1 hypothetical protein F8O04_06745 [Pseudoclavibacter endophyticus]GGA58745.1 hypothetical protein GCM10011490_05870 [Pseudoclavibacter endophyticus]